MTYFEADFKDGTTYQQGSKDVSIDTEGKNAFYDILQRQEDLLRFHVVHGDIRYTVDLEDGHYEVNGNAFTIHDQNYTPAGTLKLIYFKEMHQNFRVGEATPYEIKVNRMFIGWENNVENKNTKTTLAIVM